MDLVVNMSGWNKLSPKMKRFVEDEVRVYSGLHHNAIQTADVAAWEKFEKAGTEVSRLGTDDVEKFTKIAVPIWFKWANKDKDAARLFKLQLELLSSPTLGYVTPDDIKGQKLDL